MEGVRGMVVVLVAELEEIVVGEVGPIVVTQAIVQVRVSVY